MQFPLEVACENCGSKLVVREPSDRGLCNHCGAVIELLTSDGSSAASAVSATPSAHSPEAESVNGMTSAIEPIEAAVAGGTWGGWIPLAALATCGLIAAASAFYFLSSQSLSPNLTRVEPQAVVELDAEPTQTKPVEVVTRDYLSIASAIVGSELQGISAVSDDRRLMYWTAAHSLHPIKQATGGQVIDQPPSTLVGSSSGPVSAPPADFDYVQIKLPDLQKMPIHMAVELCTHLNLKCACRVPNADFMKDLVWDYAPRGKVSDGTAIDITSTGGTVPNLLGKSTIEAADMVSTSRFQPDYDSQVAENHRINRQVPPAGEIWRHGDSVAFCSMAMMPQLEGLKVSQALQKLDAEGICYEWAGPTGYEPSQWPNDVICRQIPLAKQEVFRGTAYLRQRGTRTPQLLAGVQVPQIVNNTGDEAERKLDELGIEYEVPGGVKKVYLKPAQKIYVNPVVGTIWHGENVDQFAFARSADLVPPPTAATYLTPAQHTLAQFGGGTQETIIRQEDVEDGPPIVVQQKPAAGQVLCRTQKLRVWVQQPMIRNIYVQSVSAGNSGGGGMRGGTPADQGGGGMF